MRSVTVTTSVAVEDEERQRQRQAGEDEDFPFASPGLLLLYSMMDELLGWATQARDSPISMPGLQNHRDLHAKVCLRREPRVEGTSWTHFYCSMHEAVHSPRVAGGTPLNSFLTLPSSRKGLRAGNAFSLAGLAASL
jgi:hypothetical protein